MRRSEGGGVEGGRARGGGVSGGIAGSYNVAPALTRINCASLRIGDWRLGNSERGPTAYYGMLYVKSHELTRRRILVVY